MGSPFENIEQLIRSIIDVEIDKYPIIQKCPDISKHVIMVEDKAYCNKYYSKFPRIESEVVKSSLLVSINTPTLGRTLERVCFNLNSEYSDTIFKKKFSWSNINEQWREFEEQEIEMISSIK